MIDLKELEKQLRSMKPRQALYELVKKEMMRRGRWKQKPRGKSFNSGYDENRKTVHKK